MTSDAKRRFVRSLRSLDRDAFVAFVAALWAARGWEARTDRDAGGVDLVVRREGHGTRSIRVVAGVSAWLAVVRLLVWPGSVDSVVTRGRLAALAVDGNDRLRHKVAFEHVSIDDLYARFRYGLDDDEQERQWEEYLEAGFEGSSRFDESTAVRTFGAVLDRATSLAPIDVGVPTSTLLGAAFVAFVVAVIVSGAVVEPFVVVPSGRTTPSPTDAEETNSPAGPADLRTPGPAPPETTRSAAMSSVCPAPSIDAHPAAIRPGVVGTASASGLEGWSIRFEGNVTDFDPNDESNRVAPEVRHLVVYETPSERQYHLAIDRWESATRAADRSTWAEGGYERTPLVWGSYSITVEPYAAGEPERIAADVRVLLANVQTPGGITLGDRCVDALEADA